MLTSYPKVDRRTGKRPKKNRRFNTMRRKLVLNFIREYLHQHLQAPSCAEIGHAFQMKPQEAHRYTQELIKSGHLERGRAQQKARNLRLVIRTRLKPMDAHAARWQADGAEVIAVDSLGVRCCFVYGKGGDCIAVIH